MCQGRINEWIQVDLEAATFVTGVITQGRGDLVQYVSSYKIAYGNTTNNIQVIIGGNGDPIVSRKTNFVKNNITISNCIGKLQTNFVKNNITISNCIGKLQI